MWFQLRTKVFINETRKQILLKSNLNVRFL